MALCGVHDQLRCFQLWPQPGRHFMPLNIFVPGTIGSGECRFCNGYARNPVYEAAVIRHPLLAICAGPYMTLGLGDGIGRRPKHHDPGLGWRRHQSVQFIVVDMSFELPSQGLTLPNNQYEFAKDFTFPTLPHAMFGVQAAPRRFWIVSTRNFTLLSHALKQGRCAEHFLMPTLTPDHDVRVGSCQN